MSATVTVTSETGQTLQTENANVDKAITTVEVRTLPQFGRDPYELARLTPGVFGDAARGGTGGAVNLPNTAGPADRLDRSSKRRTSHRSRRMASALLPTISRSTALA